ncbi:la-related protein 6-like protein [Dinothrombium tinctorium]|uniref:La-related protein 6-like protein n=1 Tax=Dinothrombium tinctorium TaxID=1965070 RepID=A0A3S3R1H8_9ACAR|nr:la-related protein 6-like protein [Dinothrombium tinctorium]RWS15832.1 la-related protein 6-like protein [Dinothrombium tinctorium]RWS17077.1 la-related protein 6-like protein [Dinothrombium tinctorium]
MSFDIKDLQRRLDECHSQVSYFFAGDSCSSEEGDLDSNSSNSNGIDSDSNDSRELGKDSGVDCFDDFTLPDAELIRKIVEQVESYFEDSNLLKDAFLLKHIRRNKEGFVSLKLVSSFRKVRNLNKNWKVVAYSLKNGSSKLEINDSFTKVRRTAPLPEYLEAKSRTIVAFNFPFVPVTVETVSKLFSAYGQIVSIRILHKGGPIPLCLKQFFEKYRTIGDMVSALIEFESSKIVDKIIKQMNIKRETNWRNNLQIYKLDDAIKLSISKKSQQSKENSTADQHKCDEKHMKTKYRREKYDTRRNFSNNFLTDLLDSNTSSCSENEQTFGSSLNRDKKSTLQGLSPNSPVFRQKSNSYSGGNHYETSKSCTNSPLHLPYNNRVSNLIRAPRGPDGSKGFAESICRQLRSRSEPFPMSAC